MNRIILYYIIKKFLKTFFMLVIGFYCFGIILNLFEELEFFKNTNAKFYLPYTLTLILIPGMTIKLLPFIIFISSMWFMVNIKDNKDLLMLKTFGYSNLKLFNILALISFILGWSIITIFNPLTAKMTQYYEKTKSKYSRDIDHLVFFNRNGLWIKENLIDGKRIITAKELEEKNLINMSIISLSNNNDFKKKIISQKTDISKNNWKLYDVKIFTLNDGVTVVEEYENYEINSLYNYEKITGLFKNFDTMSFLNIVLNYNDLLKQGYSKTFLDNTLNVLLTLPFLLMMMTGLASILTLNSLKKTNNLKYVFLSFLVVIIVFYFKDLSLALGQAGKISLQLSIWSPVIALSLFIFIGILQINEK